MKFNPVHVFLLALCLGCCQSQEVCPPCDGAICAGGMCPLIAPFLCLEGPASSGCSATSWNNPAACAYCCDLSACGGPGPAPPPPSPMTPAPASPAFAMTIVPPSDQDVYVYVGGDEFLASDVRVPSPPNATNWAFDMGYIANNEQQWFTSSLRNAFVVDGMLNIVARREAVRDFGYTSARLTSQRRFCLEQDSYLAIRCKVPGGRGTWPAAWTLGPPDEVWPVTGELDLMEAVGFDSSSVWQTMHTASNHHKNGSQLTRQIPVPRLLQDFFEYGLEWNSTGAYFSIDGNVTFALRRGSSSAAWPFMPGRCFSVILNLAIGGDWGGKDGIDNSIFPVTFLVDYVRLYSKHPSSSIYYPDAGPAEFALLPFSKAVLNESGWGLASFGQVRSQYFAPFIASLPMMGGEGSCNPHLVFVQNNAYLFLLPGGYEWDIVVRGSALQARSGVVPSPIEPGLLLQHTRSGPMQQDACCIVSRLL